MVGHLCENAHGYYSYYYPVTVTASGVIRHTSYAVLCWQDVCDRMSDSNILQLSSKKPTLTYGGCLHWHYMMLLPASPEMRLLWCLNLAAHWQTTNITVIHSSQQDEMKWKDTLFHSICTAMVAQSQAMSPLISSWWTATGAQFTKNFRTNLGKA